MTGSDEKLNEPVRPNEVEKNGTIGVGGLADEKRLRENEEALDAAYADEGETEEPFLKRMRRKYTEKSKEAQDSPDVDSDESEEGEESETRPAKAIRDPGEVTQKDIEQHRMKNHLPFRIWCPYCLAAKGKERPHFKGGAARRGR